MRKQRKQRKRDIDHINAHLTPQKKIKQIEDFDPALTYNEVSTLLRCSYATVARRVKAGDIKGIRPGPKLVRVRMSEVKRFLDEAGTAVPVAK